MAVWGAISGRQSVGLFNFVFGLLDEKREFFLYSGRGFLSSFLSLVFLICFKKVWDTVFHTNRIIKS